MLCDKDNGTKDRKIQSIQWKARKDVGNNVIESTRQTDVFLPSGSTFTQLPAFKPDIKSEGYFVIEYIKLGF